MAGSTPTLRPSRERGTGCGAFTLVEFVVAATLSGFVLAGVLSANLQLMKSGLRVTHYAEMDTQVRRSFEQLAIDAKAASAFTYNGASDITVTVAESDGTTSQFTYAWNSTTQIFYRVNGASSSGTTNRINLATGITALTFSRLNTSGAAATTDGATKRIKLTLTLNRTNSLGAKAVSTATNSYTLRNKPVS
jgi:type II secretory pathway pseudopilin PulG